MREPVLQLSRIVTEFRGTKRFLAPAPPPIVAVNDVSLEVNEGEVLGLVGESGCGKSTLAKTILGLYREKSGDIQLNGKEVSGVEPRRARRLRSDIQYVHQDPGAALDPWWRVGGILHESLRINGMTDRGERDRLIDEMLEAVGLAPSFKRRYPHELSGGQQRRVGLARTLILRPRLIILDEPTSGLDLSVQATVLRLMRDIREQFGLTYIFISHDLSVVERMCDRVAIMYLGRIVELGTTGEVFARPRHPYTHALLEAAPSLEPGQLDRAKMIEGDPPSVRKVPAGCAFHTRCDYSEAACVEAVPPLEEADGHLVRCIRWPELRARLATA
ncbi:ABC transporter ATP-binding protein [Acuticoccus sediminis]|uniref:ABC transporter ATP-binding protein n=1 Tax=Acuticoccus sediminis TaxID=2184697 RepID=UPI001CFED8AC|nr:ABC transporter ATP-binding protein [Acuticoccus sediminis]